MLTLTSGESSIVVAPEHGGGIIGWMLGRTPLLRRALPQATVGANRHTMGCFALLPYCNRIDMDVFTGAAPIIGWNPTSAITRTQFTA